MKYNPHPHQKAISLHSLEHPRSNVWAGMGLGKTAATLTAIDGMQMIGDLSGPALVLAPKRVALSTWPDETQKWDHLKHMEVQPIVGTVVERIRAICNPNAAVFATNYDNLVWLCDHFAGERWPFRMVVADESTRLKSFRLGGSGGKRARAIGRLAHKQVDRWVNLTGTPSPNGFQDLWGQAWMLDAGERLGRTYTAFESRWFRKGHNGYGLELLPTAKEQIEDRIRDITLSIAPPWQEEPIISPVYVELPPKARALYRAMEKEMFMTLRCGVEVEAFNAASRTIKCLQLANGAAYTDDTGKWEEVHDAKLQALESIITEAAGAPVLVAYHFKSDLQRLRAAFPKGRHLDDDPQTLRDWNAGRVPVLFAHPASAGHGLNLQDGGNILAIFGHWWNLEEYLQIIERIGPARQRQSGHDRPTYVYPIVAKDTVDELVMKRRETKRTLQDLLMEAMR